MKKLNIKDKKLRDFYLKNEHKHLVLKSLLDNKQLQLNFRYYIRFKIKKLLGKYYKSKIKNRCILTGRSRAVIRFFHMSRLKVKDFVLVSLLIGVRKSSW